MIPLDAIQYYSSDTTHYKQCGVKQHKNSIINYFIKQNKCLWDLCITSTLSTFFCWVESKALVLGEYNVTRQYKIDEVLESYKFD